MRKKTQGTIINNSTVTVDTAGLMQMLNCGRQTATQIGAEAQAKIQINKRVLWHLPKIRRYLDGLAGEVDT